jgi:electron transfer flavoprotein alpha subunit
MSHIFCYIQHADGRPDDSAAELAAAAAKIDAANRPIAVATGWGKDLDSVCEALCTSFREVWKVTAEALVYPNAELVRQALGEVVPRGSIVIAPHNHFGIDLSPGLSIKLDAAYVPDVVEIAGLDGNSLRVVRQEFGGQVSTHVVCDLSSGAVLNVRPGAFKVSEGAAAVGRVREWPVGLLRPRRRYLSTVPAEAGEVDITKYKLLVSVGRGIQDPENIELAEQLAEALGGAVSCSRPVVDAKWLEKSRQVGSSGKTVKPKVYLACGISGSFQHLAGIKGNPLIVAINKNPKAPIFRVAEIGIIDDILEFLPELTTQVRQRRGVGSKAAP